MYSREDRCWKSEQYDASIIAWCREPFNKENPEAMFILSDSMLESASKGKQTSEAVYLMEKAAKLGNARAALAMGQMFRYGWAVSRSRKSALMWYEKAAQLGDAEAAHLLEEWKRQRRRTVILSVAAVALTAFLVCGLLFKLWSMRPVEGILVHENTQLRQTDDLEEFASALNELVAQYDDELVISGQRGSNRLMLRFEGSGIDLSDFPAAVVIEGGENFLIVQFDSEIEAQRCLEILKNTKGVLFVEEDSYKTEASKTMTANDLTSTGTPYTSPNTGEVYYSWGVEYLGMDKLAAWIMTQQTDPVTVAVLDTGSEPCRENAHLYLAGYDTIDTANNHGWTDVDGHGTHVAGTIIDCTWGLDIQILPIRVLGPNGQPDSCIATGLMIATQDGVDVINMSLGGPCMHSDPGQSCGSALDWCIEDAVNHGIVVVVAAGNGDKHGNPVSTADTCPGHLDCCIVTAACDSLDRLASFSNFGESVDVCAPGVGVVSYYPGDTYASLSGTSMAAPHISALVAMLKMTMPGKTPEQIEKYIIDYCVDMGNSRYYGEGIPWAGYFAGN